MNYIKKILFFIGALGALAFASTVFASQITVPSAPSAGYTLVATSTGNYIATTTDPLHFGSFFATSTNATSTIMGNLMIGNAIKNGNLRNLGFGAVVPAQLQVSDNVNDFTGAIIANTNTGALAGASLSFMNGATSATEGVNATNYASIGFGGNYFQAYPGLQPNGLGILVTDGGLSLATGSANFASSSVCIAIGPGYSLASCDFTFADANPAVYPQDAYTGHFGIGTTSPFGYFAMNASSTSQYPLMNIATSTNGTVVNPGKEDSIFYISSPASGANVAIGTSSPNHKFEVYNKNDNVVGLTTIEPAVAIVNGSSVVGTGSSLAFSSLSGGTDTTLARISDVSTNLTAGIASGNLNFYTRNAGTQQQDMTILSNGKVGIGTTSPYTPLSVVGTGGVVAESFTATSTTVASTFPYASTTAISVSGLTSGNCVQASTGGLLTTTGSACGSGGGPVTVNAGITGQNAYYSAANTISATNDIFFNGSGTGFGSSTPWAQVSIGTSTWSSGPLFAIGSTTAGGLSTTTDFLIASGGNTYIGTTTSGTTNQFVVQNQNTNTNIAQLFSSGGVSRFMVSDGGTMTVQAITSNAITSTGGSTFTAGTVATVPLTTRGASALQTGDIQQWFKNNATTAQIGEVTALGKFALGTTTPWGQFSIATTTAGLTNPLFVISTSTLNGLSTSTPFIVDQNGNTGHGTTTPAFLLDINGVSLHEPTTAPANTYKGTLWNDSTQNEIAFGNGNTLYQGGNLYTATADATINTTSPTSALSGTKVGTTVIAANTLKVGQKFTVWGAGNYTTPIGNTSTVTITPSIASSTVTNISTVTTGALPSSATNLPFDFTLTCTIRSIGVSATLVCDGAFNYSTAVSAVAKTSNSLSTIGTITFDSTVAETLDVKASWSTVTTQTATVQQSRIDFI